MAQSLTFIKYLIKCHLTIKVLPDFSILNGTLFTSFIYLFCFSLYHLLLYDLLYNLLFNLFIYRFIPDLELNIKSVWAIFCLFFNFHAFGLNTCHLSMQKKRGFCIKYEYFVTECIQNKIFLIVSILFRTGALQHLNKTLGFTFLLFRRLRNHQASCPNWLFSLIQSHLLIFAFVSFAFVAKFNKLSPELTSRSLSAVFYSGSFMVSALTSRYSIHSELLSVWYKKVFCFIVLLEVVQFNQHHLLKRLLFPHYMFLALGHNQLIGHKSINLYVCFMLMLLFSH